VRALRRTDLKSLVEFVDSLDHVKPSDFAGRVARSTPTASST